MDSLLKERLTRGLQLTCHQCSIPFAAVAAWLLGRENGDMRPQSTRDISKGAKNECKDNLSFLIKNCFS